MKPELRELHLVQLDQSLKPFRAAQVVTRPQPGWLRALREALGISIREVARKMRKTPQTVAAFEKSEAADRITLQTLRHYAEAMDCEFVYAVVPKTGSLKQLAEKHARHKAETHARVVENAMGTEIQDKTDLEPARLMKKS